MSATICSSGEQPAYREPRPSLSTANLCRLRRSNPQSREYLEARNDPESDLLSDGRRCQPRRGPQTCSFSIAGLNRSRVVMGPVHTECPGTLHSAPFWNWRASSSFGSKRNGNQFDGWCRNKWSATTTVSAVRNAPMGGMNGTVARTYTNFALPTALSIIPRTAHNSRPRRT